AEEIVVVHRSVSRAAPVIERVFEQYGIPLAIDRRVPFGHTALGRGVLALARCALLDDGEASAEDLLAYLRYPGLVDRLEVLDRLESQMRCGGLRTAAQAREQLGWRLEEIDAVRAAANPGAELVRHARRLLAAPHRGEQTAPVLNRAEAVDARALSTMLGALAQIEELGDKLAGAELIELLTVLEVPASSEPRP